MDKKKNALYGAIYGDIIGRKYEFPKMQSFPSVESIEDFPEDGSFTDDTLMTLATASYILGDFETIEEAYKTIGLKYDGDYYGQGFKEWLKTPSGTINTSYANGCLMRISPFMYFDNKEVSTVNSALCSHNHAESIWSVLRLTELYKWSGGRKISSKNIDTKKFKVFTFFNIKAVDTIEFIEQAYWYSNNTVDTIKKVISFGGDTDTNASIIGELMNFTFNDLSDNVCSYVESKLDGYLLDILKRFNNKVNKTFYRVCNENTQQGLWYDFSGNFTGLIHNDFNFCQNNSLEMEFDEELVGWLSAVEKLEDLWKWFSQEDIKQLQKHGWYIFEYQAEDSKFYDRFQHLVIKQDTSKVIRKIEL